MDSRRDADSICRLCLSDIIVVEGLIAVELQGGNELDLVSKVHRMFSIAVSP